jgi:phage terminase small subunit
MPAALLALNARQRKFIAALADDPISTGAKIKAARKAGLGSATSSKVSMRNLAHQMMNNDAVQRALHEIGYKLICGDIFRYVENLKVVANDPRHRHHVKANLELLRLAGFETKTEHTVKVEHSIDMREIEGLVMRLSAETGIPVNRLLGNDAKVIEGTAKEVKS